MSTLTYNKYKWGGSMKIITLDAGHGGKDCGAVGFGNFESKNTLSQTLILKKELEKQGFKVFLTRSNDEFIELSTRKNIADNNKSDLLISIHNNSFSNTNSNGIETWNYPNSKNGSIVGKLIQDELVKSTGLTNRGNKESKFTVLTGNCVAVLLELGFISNKVECELLKSIEFQNKCAIAITKGVCKYFNVEFNEKENTNKVNYTLEFQKWYNEVTQTKKPLSVDGIFGKETKDAYELIGKLINK